MKTCLLPTPGAVQSGPVFGHLIASDRSRATFADGEDIRMIPCGVNPTPEWALDDVGEPINDGPAYTYPDTTVPVRLYLIDTSVANTNGWIDANPKLTLERIELIRGATDFQGTYSTDHGTKLLSLIGAIETGIAPGTPIHVVNYDIYPAAETTVALLATAINRAVQDHKNPSNPLNPMRSVICIATSSTDPFNQSGLLQQRINSALAEEIPVIVSAGNHSPQGLNASNFIPASYGTTGGVICVGASDQNNVVIPISNFGTPVDLLAPGNAVRVRTNNSAVPFGNMTGTSPATALVAGSALTELSINGQLTAAQVETNIKTCGILPPGGQGPKILRTTVSAAAFISTPDGPIIPPSNPLPLGGNPALFSGGPGGPVIDTDSDGMPDVVEEFYGSISQSSPPPPSVVSPAPSNQTTFKFPIASGLMGGADPFTLNNGVHWRIRCSTNLASWLTPTGSLVKTTDATGQVWLTATIPSPGPACYVRIELADPN